MTMPVPVPVDRRIAAELGVREAQVASAVALLDAGATVPFIARYRKEATGGLDDTQLRTLEERLRYLRELEERRGAILESIRGQGQLEAKRAGAKLGGAPTIPPGGLSPVHAVHAGTLNASAQGNG